MMALLCFPTLFRIAWKCESKAFLFFISTTVRSLRGVFYARTASHLSRFASCA
jgi:hypothetical protein